MKAAAATESVFVEYVLPGCLGSTLYAPRPPLTPSWPEGMIQGRGGGILKPPAAGILHAPSLLYVPHP